MSLSREIPEGTITAWKESAKKFSDAIDQADSLEELNEAGNEYDGTFSSIFSTYFNRDEKNINELFQFHLETINKFEKKIKTITNKINLEIEAINKKNVERLKNILKQEEALKKQEEIITESLLRKSINNLVNIAKEIKAFKDEHKKEVSKKLHNNLSDQKTLDFMEQNHDCFPSALRNQIKITPFINLNQECDDLDKNIKNINEACVQKYNQWIKQLNPIDIDKINNIIKENPQTKEDLIKSISILNDAQEKTTHYFSFKDKAQKTKHEINKKLDEDFTYIYLAGKLNEEENKNLGLSFQDIKLLITMTDKNNIDQKLDDLANKCFEQLQEIDKKYTLEKNKIASCLKPIKESQQILSDDPTLKPLQKIKNLDDSINNFNDLAKSQENITILTNEYNSYVEPIKKLRNLNAKAIDSTEFESAKNIVDNMKKTVINDVQVHLANWLTNNSALVNFTSDEKNQTVENAEIILKNMTQFEKDYSDNARLAARISEIIPLFSDKENELIKPLKDFVEKFNKINLQNIKTKANTIIFKQQLEQFKIECQNYKNNLNQRQNAFRERNETVTEFHTDTLKNIKNYLDPQENTEDISEKITQLSTRFEVDYPDDYKKKYTSVKIPTPHDYIGFKKQYNNLRLTCTKLGMKKDLEALILLDNDIEETISKTNRLENSLERDLKNQKEAMTKCAKLLTHERGAYETHTRDSKLANMVLPSDTTKTLEDHVGKNKSVIHTMLSENKEKNYTNYLIITDEMRNNPSQIISQCQNRIEFNTEIADYIQKNIIHPINNVLGKINQCVIDSEFEFNTIQDGVNQDQNVRDGRIEFNDSLKKLNPEISKELDGLYQNASNQLISGSKKIVDDNKSNQTIWTNTLLVEQNTYHNIQELIYKDQIIKKRWEFIDKCQKNIITTKEKISEKNAELNERKLILTDIITKKQNEKQTISEWILGVENEIKDINNYTNDINNNNIKLLESLQEINADIDECIADCQDQLFNIELLENQTYDATYKEIYRTSKEALSKDFDTIINAQKFQAALTDVDNMLKSKEKKCVTQRQQNSLRLYHDELNKCKKLFDESIKNREIEKQSLEGNRNIINTKINEIQEQINKYGLIKAQIKLSPNKLKNNKTYQDCKERIKNLKSINEKYFELDNSLLKTQIKIEGSIRKNENKIQNIDNVFTKISKIKSANIEKHERKFMSRGDYENVDSIIFQAIKAKIEKKLQKFENYHSPNKHKEYLRNAYIKSIREAENLNQLRNAILTNHDYTDQDRTVVLHEHISRGKYSIGNLFKRSVSASHINDIRKEFNEIIEGYKLIKALNNEENRLMPTRKNGKK